MESAGIRAMSRSTNVSTFAPVTAETGTYWRRQVRPRRRVPDRQESGGDFIRRGSIRLRHDSEDRPTLDLSLIGRELAISGTGRSFAARQKNDVDLGPRCAHEVIGGAPSSVRGLWRPGVSTTISWPSGRVKTPRTSAVSFEADQR